MWFPANFVHKLTEFGRARGIWSLSVNRILRFDQTHQYCRFKLFKFNNRVWVQKYQGCCAVKQDITLVLEVI